MAILRQANLLGQQRVDVPTLRQVEASIAGDFDMLCGRTLAANRPLVIRGFTINTQGVVGAAANTLQLATADGIVANVEATESGSLLWIPTDRAAETLNSTLNSNVVGSFTPSATNNIGIDFVRSADSSTADVVQFLDPSTKLETAKIVPLARTLNYRIVITTQPFSAQPNLIPIATVVTTAQNNVSSIVDARNMFGRLAQGGDFPSTATGWTFSSPRTESATSSFSGPDKNFEGLKDWADAIMTRIWEVGGGEAWFSGTADRNVNFVFVGTPYISGEYFTWDGTNLHWKGLRFIFDNSAGRYNDIKDQTTDSSGLTNLADGECLYVDLKRDTNATGGTALQAVKAALATLGTGSPPGARTIFAWRDGSNIYYRGWRFPVGQGFAPATTTTNGIVTLFQAPGNSTNPVVLNLNSNGSIAWTASGGNATALSITGNGTGFGVRSQGGPNTSTAGGPTFGTTPVPGPAGVGGVFLGGGGTQGGDGIQAFGLSTTNPKAGGVFSGSWVGVDLAVPGVGTESRGGWAFTNANGGGGAVGIGGRAHGVGKQGGAGGNFTGGDGTSSAAGGVGVVAQGGTGSGTQTIGLVSTAGPNGGDGIKGFAVCGAGAQRAGVVGTGGNAAQNGDPGGGGVLGFGANAIGGSADGGYGVAGTGGLATGAGTNGPGGQFQCGVASTAATPQSALKLTNGNMDMNGVANPNNNVGFVNVLTPKNICKAWASFTASGSTGTLQDGFNCTITGNTGPTRMTVTFVNAMANSNYSVALAVGTVEDGGHNLYNYAIESKSSSGFDIRCYLQGTGGTTFPGQTISFQVFGAQ